MAERVYVGRVMRRCEHCGAEFTRRNSQIKNPDHVFCSRDCYLVSDYFTIGRDASNARRFAGMRDQRPCLNCGADVDRPQSQFNKKTYCSTQCRASHALTRGHRQVNSGGYIKVFVGRGALGADNHGHILEHRLVMQEHIGRSLLPQETVHHRNGERADNRLANLELWSHSQPPGQRVVDKLKWAREFVALYDGLGSPLA